MTALAVVLAAQAPAAFAQDRDGVDRPEHEGARGEWRGRPDGGGVRPQREWSETRSRPPQAREAPPAPQAPQAPAAAEPRARGDGFQGRRDGYRGTGGQEPGRRWEGRGDGARGEGPRSEGPRSEGPRGDGVRDGRRWEGDRGGWDRRDGDRRDGDRRDHDRRDGDPRWDGRRDDGRRDGDRRWDRGDRDRWDGRGEHRRWERGRYPPTYFSSHRYRYAWRPPTGFYLRSWSYGDFFPRAWFGPGYWIVDPWQYDLPLPPPGFEWVRSGPDALLIDEYTGRIVQVVRNIFWY